MFKKIGLSLFALVFTYITAMAITGNQIGYPIVGGASYCGSFGNNGVCNQTTLAGPTVITGNETIVANTNLPGGQNPQTVLITMADLGALSYQYVAGPLTSGTTTLTNLVGTLILDPTQAIAAYTVVMPPAASLTDGQILRVASSLTITALTITAGSGSTVSNAPSSVTGGNLAGCKSGANPCGYEFIYSAPITEWFRLQ